MFANDPKWTFDNYQIMTLKNTKSNYGFIAKWIHWAIAILFLCSYCAVYFRHWFTEEKTPENIEQALEEFKIWRKKQIKLIKSFKQNIFEKNGSHNQYKQYDMVILIRHILFHDHWHMYRMEDIWFCKDEYFVV